MPIFEYRCGECRKKFERIVLSVAGTDVPKCPHCGAVKAERLVSRFATSGKGASDDLGGDFGGGEGFDDEGEAYGDPGESEPFGPGGDDDEEYDGDPDAEVGEEDD